MYSTNINHDRCRVDCIIVAEDIAVENFIVDTGARYTCCNYCFVSGRLDVERLKGNEAHNIGGMIEGDKVCFYRYSLRQFTVGNIDMGRQDIWVTFDERVTDIILGMDILKQIIMITNPYNQQVYFCKDCEDYNKNFELLAI